MKNISRSLWHTEKFAKNGVKELIRKNAYITPKLCVKAKKKKKERKKEWNERETEKLELRRNPFASAL